MVKVMLVKGSAPIRGNIVRSVNVRNTKVSAVVKQIRQLFRDDDDLFAGKA